MIVNALNARIAERIEVAPDAIILRVAPEGWRLPEYEPGQLAALGLLRRTPAGPQKMTVRTYSIASSPAARDHVEFYVGLERGTRFTQRVFDLKEGDPVWLSPRFTGGFLLAGDGFAPCTPERRGQIRVEYGW